MKTLVSLLALALFAQGCAAHPAKPAATPAASIEWTSKLEALHPLVGKIWDVQNKRFIERAELDARLAKASYVLLGEKHDNPDHHMLQAQLLGAMIANGRAPDVAFEMLDEEDQPSVTAAIAQAPNDPDAVARAVQWEKSGWPPFAYYRPIVAEALSAHLAIHAVNLSRKAARGVMFHGLSVLGDRAGQMFLDRDLDPKLRASLEEELRASHCGQLPEQMVAPMANAQRARDATIGFDLAATEPDKGAVLIAGDGHARLDRGVPLYIKPRRPNADVVSVGILEVDRGLAQPADYAAALGAAELPFSYVWFTPRVSSEDPCRAFRTPGSGTIET
jgi:uncharacterized iron-regulated protein